MSCQFIYTSPAFRKKQGGPSSPPKKKQQQPNTLHYFAQRRTGCDQIRVEHILCIYKSTSQEAHAFCSSKRLAVIVWRCEGPYEKTVYETRRREESDFSHEPECRLVQFFQHHASSLDLFAYTIHTDRTADCAKFELIYITYIYSIDTVI